MSESQLHIEQYIFFNFFRESPPEFDKNFVKLAFQKHCVYTGKILPGNVLKTY